MVGIFSASAVESVNMVGFAKVNLGQGLNIIGAPFVTVGDTETSLDDLFDLSEFTAGSSIANSDVVTVWNGSGYDGYFLYAFAGPGFNETAWVDGSYVEADVVLQPGEAVWLKRFAAAADITFKGEVMSAASTDVSLATGLNMVSFPYSVSASLNDFDISNATAGSSIANSDVVTVWNGSGYDGYFLYAFAGPGFNETAWVDGSYVETDVSLPIGGGVWYKAFTAATISADKPY
jgi:hypothetical protein